MKKRKSLALILPVIAVCVFLGLNALKNDRPLKNIADNSGLTLPGGFNAVIIAANLGSTRHIAVTPEGNIYVRLIKLKNGKGTIELHESGDKAEVVTSFGDFTGTGIFIKNGYLYTSSNHDVYRYKLNSKNEVIDPDHPEKIISGLIGRSGHPEKAITLDNGGNIYVNIGSLSNICSDREDKKDCPVLDSTAGIWQFKADKPNQHFSDGIHYATGLRNVVGMAWNQQDNQLFVTQNGRDNLHAFFPDLYTAQQSAELPAECMFAIKKGDNAGWPYVYYDWMQHKNMLGPEYGGDGKKAADSKFINPVAAYPGHYAPVGLLFYTGSQFPEKYKNGAFIAFHGSWNRAPEPQAGYFVVFQPFKDGKPDGKCGKFLRMALPGQEQ